MLLLCIRIFFARLLDVSLATFRTMVLVKGQKILPAILGFFEVLVWLMVVEEALKTETDSLWVPVSYAAGYAIGSLIGTWISNKFIKSMCAVQVITDKNNTKLINAIKKAGYGISIIALKKDSNEEKKEMLFIEVNNSSVKSLKSLINKHDKNAFVVVSDSKFVVNGYIK
ncbi:MAG: DUF2179 domain-containing protein [Bacilli bacterium]|nr:DUF2179 domain-containing protein [Bacilli bacterium]